MKRILLVVTVLSIATIALFAARVSAKPSGGVTTLKTMEFVFTSEETLSEFRRGIGKDEFRRAVAICVRKNLPWASGFNEEHVNLHSISDGQRVSVTLSFNHYLESRLFDARKWNHVIHFHSINALTELAQQGESSNY